VVGRSPLQQKKAEAAVVAMVAAVVAPMVLMIPVVMLAVDLLVPLRCLVSLMISEICNGV
jgi:hypothetical protein